MTDDAVAVAKASYARCLRAPEFLLAFYGNFFRACPPAEPLFAKVDLPRQARLLQHAVGLLLAFPKGPPKEPTLLSRLAVKHGPGGLDINPEWYAPFCEALIETASQHDPGFTPATGDAWRQALAPGITYMKEYGRG